MEIKNRGRKVEEIQGNKEIKLANANSNPQNKYKQLPSNK